jgi:PAS domain S-box-containing protein
MTPQIIFFYSLIVIVAGVILLFFFRLLIRFPRAKKNREEKDSSEVGFVVDTFHELVSQLKEKERELEVLRKQAEDRATAIEGYNENILQSVQSGVVSLDEEMKITKINLAAAKILEVKKESVIGQYHTEVLNIPITDFLQNKKVIERGEIGYVTPSGKRIWLGLTLSPLRNSEGATIGQILIFTDLTHLKAIESQMELRNKLSSLGEISAGIAHELRNPMGVIAGYTKLLSKKADESLRPTVDAISREIVVMNRIISDFLSFARPVELTLADIDLKAIIEYCVMATAEKRNDVDLQLSIDNLPIIQGDEVLMRQAFINLLQNSLDAMPQGGKLTIVASLSSTDFLDITVSDTGHGISENVKDKIFLPFFTTKEKGTGLGLAIVHKIVISHGGTIHADSSDKGTAFRLRFPVKNTHHFTA